VALMVLAVQGLASPNEILGAGDTVRMTVFQNPDLTTETRISDRGAVVFPLIGEIEIAGQTPAEAGMRIAEQLKKRQFIVNPQVSVSLIQVRSRQVSVLGEVAKPGRYALDDTASKLTDILALAGGINASGDDTVIVTLARNGKISRREINVPAMYRSGDMSSDIALANGDAIYVPRAPVFYIYGEVQRAGSYRLAPETSVMSALSEGGGLTLRGTTRGLKITRRMADGTTQTLDANLVDPVKPNDVIYVKEGLF
jgi:polysaccharide export outer membrane protein